MFAGSRDGSQRRIEIRLNNSQEKVGGGSEHAKNILEAGPHWRRGCRRYSFSISVGAMQAAGQTSVTTYHSRYQPDGLESD